MDNLTPARLQELRRRLTDNPSCFLVVNPVEADALLAAAERAGQMEREQDRLRESANILQQMVVEASMERDTALSQLARERERTRALEEEVARLRAGRFTAEEIHGICHNLHGTVDARGFTDGCTAEQRRLYGCAPDADALAQARAALEGIAGRERGMGIHRPCCAEGQRRANAALRALPAGDGPASPWRRVETDPPPIDVPVLTWLGAAPQPIRVSQAPHWFTNQEDLWDGETPEFWMPLPAGPGEAGEEVGGEG